MFLVRIALTAALSVAAAVPFAGAQSPATGGPVDPALVDDLVTASRILADQGVLDAYQAIGTYPLDVRELCRPPTSR